MRRATIYFRDGSFFVHASSRSTDGVWMASEPLLKIESTASDTDLGGEFRLALEGSRTDVPHPMSWRGLLDPLLKLAGVKSWSTFAKSALCAEVEEDGGLASVVPTDNLGANGGFQPDPSRATPSEVSDPLGDRALELHEAASRNADVRTRLCEVCGRSILDPDDYLGLGLLTSDPGSALFGFNFLHLHRSHVGQWDRYEEFRRLIEALQRSEAWDGPRLVFEEKPKADIYWTRTPTR